MTRKINTCKRYIWAELTAGRAVTHLSVLNAIGSIKCQQRIHELRQELARTLSPYEIVTTMRTSPDGAQYAEYTLETREALGDKAYLGKVAALRHTRRIAKFNALKRQRLDGLGIKATRAALNQGKLKQKLYDV